MIVGAMRAGTTYLHTMLKQHPDIFLPAVKELRHFSQQTVKNGQVDLVAYSRHFSQWQGETMIGESTPEYMFYEWVPRILHARLPDLKLIFTLRNPADRAYSHYLHSVKSHTGEHLSFEQAIDRESKRTQQFDDYRLGMYSYVTRGLYLHQINNFLQYYPRSQMHFIILEEMQRNPTEILSAVCDFLGVESFSPTAPPTQNHAVIPKYLALFRFLHWVRLWSVKQHGGWRLAQMVKTLQDRLPRTEVHPLMKPATRARLEAYYAQPNRELFEYLGKDANPWSTPSSSTD
jgi:hypothetical protein